PLASLCLRLYETRSRSVNPSCEVTKLIELYGDRPSSAYGSDEPSSRVASVRIPSLVDARQKSRTVSRYWSFHSTHGGGNSPTRYPSGEAPHGSATSLTCRRTGSWPMVVSSAPFMSTWWPVRVIADARSTRKPSAYISVTQ